MGGQNHVPIVQISDFREGGKYYLADFFCTGGGGPQYLTKIFPAEVATFFTKKVVFFGPKTLFFALLLKTFSQYSHLVHPWPGL